MSAGYNLDHISNGEGRCREGEDGFPCAQCDAAFQAEYRDWLRKWNNALPSERDPKAYAESLIDAGRGHLVKREGYR